MNTNTLKKFAQNARRKLLQQVAAKLEYVLAYDTVELREKAKEIKTLQDELARIGKAQLVEKVAYTWFNRLMALRFMDANDYQPAGVRIVSPKDGYTLPQILDEAKQAHFPAELPVDQQKVLDILDGRLPSKNPQNEAYRYLLIAACNALHRQFPFLFERINDYTESQSLKATLSFLPDDDGIIPVLDDEWFEDDIAGRFSQFLKATFGAADYEKNLAFVETCLGKDVRKYFVKDFYNDHIRRYKKRPIYWLFASPKGSFAVLVYLHRYTPDTVNNILNNYLREFIQKLKSQKEHFQQIQVTGSTAEQNKAAKQIDTLDQMLLDCEEYERDILYPLATERIAIDLDDGVLVNYNKFGRAVKEVKGLNDKKAKDKVRKFDWIDVSAIRG